MSDKLEERKAGSVGEPTLIDGKKLGYDEFKLHLLDEVHAQIMIIVFLGSAFTIIPYFNRTLITVLEATQLFAIIGLTGFVLAYVVRRKLRLSVLDGLFYNLFGIAPLGLALLLVINAQCSSTYSETFKIVDREPEGSGFTIKLQYDALDEFWHIRNLNRDESNIRLGNLKYTFCEGIFGYRVMIERRSVR